MSIVDHAPVETVRHPSGPLPDGLAELDIAEGLTSHVSSPSTSSTGLSPRAACGAREGKSHRAVDGTSDETSDETSRTAPVAVAEAPSEAPEDEPAPVEVPAVPAAVRVPEVREWAAGQAGELRAEFTPPAIWIEPRPSLSAGWRYARWGTQAPAEGTTRTAARAGVAAGLPVRAVALYVDWLAERPSRLILAIVVYAVVAQLFPMIAPEWMVL